MINWKDKLVGGALVVIIMALLFLVLLGISAGILMLVVNWFCELFAIGVVLSFAQSCGIVLLIWAIKCLFSNNTVKIKMD